MILCGKGGGGLSCTNLSVVLDDGISRGKFASIEVVPEVFRMGYIVEDPIFLLQLKELLLYELRLILLMCQTSSYISFIVHDFVDLVLHIPFHSLVR